MGRKKMKVILTDGEDRISNLPESLIHHILSFLLMRDVIRTCVLSKRWRKIWKSAPVLRFGRKWRDHPKGVEFIDQSLVHYEGQKIKKFQIQLVCNTVSDRLESCVQFTANRGVEELDVCSKCYDGFPNCLFECLELRVLKWDGLYTKRPASFRFPSLTELHLNNAYLPHLDTSACPLLEVLTLELICDIRRDLYINAPNRKLRYLKITELYDGYKLDVEGEDDNAYLVFNAPNLPCIEFNVALWMIYKLEDISSVKTASLESVEPDDMIHQTPEGFSKLVVDFLKKFTHVKSLKLGQTYIQVLVYGEAIGLEIPSLSATCLELRTNLCPTALVGIASLLRASHGCIEQLTINMNYSTLPNEMFFEDHDIDEVKAWDQLERALSVDLHLNTILIQNYPGCHHNWSSCRRAPSMEKLLEDCDVEFKLVEVLLKSCKMLNKMNISIMKPPSQPLKFQFLYYLTKKLLVFPRASINAEVYFS